MPALTPSAMPSSFFVSVLYFCLLYKMERIYWIIIAVIVLAGLAVGIIYAVDPDKLRALQADASNPVQTVVMRKERPARWSLPPAESKPGL